MDASDVSASTTESHSETTEEIKSLTLREFSKSPGRAIRRGPGRRNVAVLERAMKLRDDLKVAKTDMKGLRQSVVDLDVYSNSKLARLDKMMAALVNRAKNLEDAALTPQFQLGPLKAERIKAFNDLVNSKGKIRVFCRVRPLFEDEGASCASFPNDYTIQVNQAAAGGGSFQPVGSTKNFEFDQVFGPHVSQSRVFEDVQPLIQSVLDGYNASIVAYGQTGSGKTYTMEGPTHDRGLIYRSFDEMFDLTKTGPTAATSFTFKVTVCEIHNEQVRDLLGKPADSESERVEIRQAGDGAIIAVGLREAPVETPVDYARVMKAAFLNRGPDASSRAERGRTSHLVVTVHVHSLDMINKSKRTSKLHLVQLAGGEKLSRSEASGNKLTESLFLNKSLSALCDCLSALTSKKGVPPYSNSQLSLYLSDSLGDESKVVLIVTCSSSQRDTQEMLSSLKFGTRARNVELTLGNRDTIKRWRDLANKAKMEASEKERQCEELQQENLRLQEALSVSDSQCRILFEELQKSWVMAGTLQGEIEKQQETILTVKAEVESYREQLTRAESLKKHQSQQYEKMSHEREVSSKVAMDAIKDSFHKKTLAMQASHEEAILKLKQDLQDDKNRLTGAFDIKIRQLQQQLTEATLAAERASVMAAVGSSGHHGRPANSAEGRDEMQRMRDQIEKSYQMNDTLHRENERLVSELAEVTIKLEEAQAALRKPSERSDSFPNAAAAMSESGYSSRMQVARSPMPHGGDMPPSYPDYSFNSETSDSISLYHSRHGLGGHGGEAPSSSPAAEQLMQVMDEFDAEENEGVVEVAKRGNVVLRQLLFTLNAVGKSEQRQYNEFPIEFRDSVLSFIGRLQKLVPIDGTLIAQIRIFYAKQVTANFPELKPSNIPEVELFLEKDSSTNSHSSLGFYPMKLNLKQSTSLTKLLSFGQKSKSMAIKSTSRGQKNGKINEVYLDAKLYATGNATLAMLLAFTDHQEIKRRIRRFLAENFDHLPLNTGAESELSKYTQAILSGWVEGSGLCPPSESRDALGNLLGDIIKRTYSIQLQALADQATSYASEAVEDLESMNALKQQLETIELRRRKVFKDMKADPGLQEHELMDSLPSNPVEEARLASLFLLEEVLQSCEDLKRGELLDPSTASKVKALLGRIVAEKIPAMLPMDKPVADQSIKRALRLVELQTSQSAETGTQQGSNPRTTLPQTIRYLEEQLSSVLSSPPESGSSHHRQPYPGGPERETYGEEEEEESVMDLVEEWFTIKFNSKADSAPIVLQCGVTPKLHVVVKNISQGLGRPLGPSDYGILPNPTVLENLPLEELKGELAEIPDVLKTVVFAKTAATARQRYTHIFKTVIASIETLNSRSGEVESLDYGPSEKRRVGSKEEGDLGDRSQQKGRVLSRNVTDTFPLNHLKKDTRL